MKIVIEALADNDNPYPDAGIATTFNFASPSNKSNTGPLERFARMVKGEPYGLMVSHVSHEFSEMVVTGNKAYQMVRVSALDGAGIVYAFRLSKQIDGEFKGMWMTDAVWPVGTHQGSQQAF